MSTGELLVVAMAIGVVERLFGLVEKGVGTVVRVRAIWRGEQAPEVLPPGSEPCRRRSTLPDVEEDFINAENVRRYEHGRDP